MNRINNSYMNLFEKVAYFVLFLLHKYVPTKSTDIWLNNFETKMIRKYIISGEPVQPLPIPTIMANQLSDDLFLKLSDNYKNPVLIKGFLKNSEAVKKWNIAYLNSILGDFNLNVVRQTNDKKLIIEETIFSDFAKNDIGQYINNNHTILSHFPQLFNDIQKEYDQLINTLCSTNLKNIHIANIFIGRGSKGVSGSNLHCGGSGNFFCMLNGKKHWTLISPEYSCILKGRVSDSGIHAQTLFDMPDKSLNETPEIFKYLKRYEILLEPGDILWNAPWWWHRIVNVTSDESIGMAIRNNKVTRLNLANNLTYTLSGHTYLLYNSYVIGLYEYFIGKKNFGISTEESSQDNVLFQINKLFKKYPISTESNEYISSPISKETG